MSSAKKFLSLSALSRRLDLPYSRAVRALKTGILRPDIIAGNMVLFDEARLPDLRRVFFDEAGATFATRVLLSSSPPLANPARIVCRANSGA